mmetsp:Transcript_1774/g.3413  ORF Transcript_1774/g.3413 Transcript_1774/m.3413 type:complete len:177 (+) Transcript_1774:474-1004(+)
MPGHPRSARVDGGFYGMVGFGPFLRAFVVVEIRREDHLQRIPNMVDDAKPLFVESFECFDIAVPIVPTAPRQGEVLEDEDVFLRCVQELKIIHPPLEHQLIANAVRKLYAVDRAGLVVCADDPNRVFGRFASGLGLQTELLLSAFETRRHGREYKEKRGAKGHQCRLRSRGARPAC